MSKTLKILLIIALVFCFTLALNYVQATSEEDNISDEGSNSEEDVINEDVTNKTDDGNTENVVNENASDVSTLSTLGTSNGTRV